MGCRWFCGRGVRPKTELHRFLLRVSTVSLCVCVCEREVGHKDVASVKASQCKINASWTESI